MKLTKDDLMRLSKERLAEIILEMQGKEMTLIPTPSTTPTPFYHPYCWEPGGICTNPLMDCINCPKHSYGYTYQKTCGKESLLLEQEKYIKKATNNARKTLVGTL